MYLYLFFGCAKNDASLFRKNENKYKIVMEWKSTKKLITTIKLY